MNLPQGLLEPALPLPKVTLPGIVGPIREPQGEQITSDRFPDSNRIKQMVRGSPPNRRIDVGDRTKSIALVLKDIGIDRTDSKPTGPGKFGRCPGVPLRKVPEHVHRDAGTTASRTVNLGRVVKLVLEGDGGRILEVLPEASTGIREPPARKLDLQPVQSGKNGVDVGH